MDNKMESKYTKGQRVAAMVCVIIIVLMYISTVVFALLKFDWAKYMLRVSLGCTLVLPILAWIYIWMIGKLTHRHTIADFDIGGHPTNHDGLVVNTKEEE